MMKHWIEIKGQRGFGDSICLYPIVKGLLQRTACIVFSDHPEVFQQLPCIVLPYDQRANINAGYLNRKTAGATTQFQDICLSLNVDEPEFKLDPVPPASPFPVEGKKLCVVNRPYLPLSGVKRDLFDREELLPTRMQEVIDKNKERWFFVQAGHGQSQSLETDASVSAGDYNDLLALLCRADAVLTQPGHMMHLGEGLGLRTYVLFAERGLRSENEFIRTIRPWKVLFTPNSFWATDRDEDLSFESFTRNPAARRLEPLSTRTLEASSESPSPSTSETA